MDDSGVSIEIDMRKYNDIADSYDDDLYEICKDNLECVFEELIGTGGIDKPKFEPDDRWYPSGNDDLFNEFLKGRLMDL